MQSVEKKTQRKKELLLLSVHQSLPTFWATILFGKKGLNLGANQIVHDTKLHAHR
jgi:hypothetical protein